MEAVYTAIVTFSALFAVMVFLRLRQRLAPLFGTKTLPIGPLVMLPIIAFLMIVAASPPLLMGALLLTFFGWRRDLYGLSSHWLLGMFLVVSILGIVGLHLNEQADLFPNAALLLPVGAVLALLAILSGEALVAGKLLPVAMSVVVAMVPLSVAPLLSPAPFTIPLDAAVIGSALLSLMLGTRGDEMAGNALRWPLALLLGFLMLRTAIAGGWIFALASVGLWVACLLWRFGAPESETMVDVTPRRATSPRVRKPRAPRPQPRTATTAAKRKPDKRNAFDF